MTPEQANEISHAIELYNRLTAEKLQLQAVMDFLMLHRNGDFQLHISGNSAWCCLPKIIRDAFVEWCFAALQREQEKLTEQQCGIRCPAGESYTLESPITSTEGLT